MSVGTLLPGPLDLVEARARLGGALDPGLQSRSVRRLSPPMPAASSDTLQVVFSVRRLSDLGQDGPVLSDATCAGRLAPGRRWVHANPRWVLSQLLRALVSEACVLSQEQIRERFPTARLASHAVVYDGARLGNASYIGHGAVIHSGVVVGERTHIGHHAIVGGNGFGWTVGPDGEQVEMPHLGGVILGSDVSLGPLCTVDAGVLSPTRIGDGTKIDAHVHIGHNAEIGRRCRLAAQVGLAGSVTLEDEVLVGGQAGFADHLTVGRGARVAAKSGVIGDVPPGAIVAGFPARPKAAWLRAMARFNARVKDNPP